MSFNVTDDELLKRTVMDGGGRVFLPAAFYLVSFYPMKQAPVLTSTGKQHKTRKMLVRDHEKETALHDKLVLYLDCHPLPSYTKKTTVVPPWAKYAPATQKTDRTVALTELLDALPRILRDALGETEACNYYEANAKWTPLVRLVERELRDKAALDLEEINVKKRRADDALAAANELARYAKKARID